VLEWGTAVFASGNEHALNDVKNPLYIVWKAVFAAVFAVFEFGAFGGSGGNHRLLFVAAVACEHG